MNNRGRSSRPSDNTYIYKGTWFNGKTVTLQVAYLCSIQSVSNVLGVHAQPHSRLDAPAAKRQIE